MKRPLFIAKSAADAFRRLCERSRDEHGAALVGSQEYGDIVSIVPAPDTTERSAVIVKLKGSDLEAGVARAKAEHPGSALVGYGHLHIDGPPGLSGGDHEQLARLHGDPRLPGFGIVALLAVKPRVGAVRLHAWIARAPNVVEEMDLKEVEDPTAARAAETPAPVRPPALRSHALVTDIAAQRFEKELHELQGEAYEVTATTVERGVELRLRHADLAGELALTIPAEGWERPPRVSIIRSPERSEHIVAPLANFFSGWSSAFSLVDLIRFIRARAIWSRRVGTVAANGAEATS